MEIDTLFGLPAHPLLVHVPVVLIPLASVALVVAALVPRWRLRVGVPAAVAAVVAALFVQLAAGSGEALERTLDESRLIERHAGMADGAQLAAWVLAGLAVLFVAWEARGTRVGADRSVGAAAAPRGDGRQRFVTLGLAAALVLGAGFATVEVARVGHSGAKAAWDDAASTGPDADGG